jgi:hypothetical protein
MKSQGSTQEKSTAQSRDVTVFFRLLAEAQQALVQLMAAPEGSTKEQEDFSKVLAKLQSDIAMYLGQSVQESEVASEPTPTVEQAEPEDIKSDMFSEPVSDEPEIELLQPVIDSDPRITQIANRVLRELLRSHSDMALSPDVTEQDIQLFNLLFESDRRKALIDLGLTDLSEDQIIEIEAGDAELALFQQLQNKTLAEYLSTWPGPALWEITQEKINQLNDSTEVTEQADILEAVGITDVSPSEWVKIGMENARIQSLQDLDNWLFNALFASFPDLTVETDDDGSITSEAEDAIQAIRTLYDQPVLDRDEFEESLDELGLQHDWLNQPADLTGVPSVSAYVDASQTWWQCFETDHQRVRAADCFVDPTLRQIIASDPKYIVKDPLDVSTLAIINQAKSTILRGEYLAALRALVPRLILSSEQFEQITAFLQALEYLKKAVSIDIDAKIEAADNTFNRVKKETITYAHQLTQAEEKINLVKQTLEDVEKYFVEELTQDVVDITFSALDTVFDIQNVLPKGPLLQFFQLRKKLDEYQIELALLEGTGKLPEMQEKEITEQPDLQKPEEAASPPILVSPRIPENVATVIQLTLNEKWAGLLEQTQEAVGQVAERFGWTGEPDQNDQTQIIYTYANGLKIVYSKNGVSYYERNLEDAQLSEEFQQKETELAYAWVELVRPSVLVEPVVLSGTSQKMLGLLVSEFKARRIEAVIKTAGGRTSGDSKGKGFFQTLTDAAHRLDQFGRYLDKSR